MSTKLKFNQNNFLKSVYGERLEVMDFNPVEGVKENRSYMRSQKQSEVEGYINEDFINFNYEKFLTHIIEESNIIYLQRPTTDMWSIPTKVYVAHKNNVTKEVYENSIDASKSIKIKVVKKRLTTSELRSHILTDITKFERAFDDKVKAVMSAEAAKKKESKKFKPRDEAAIRRAEYNSALRNIIRKGLSKKFKESQSETELIMMCDHETMAGAMKSAAKVREIFSTFSEEDTPRIFSALVRHYVHVAHQSEADLINFYQNVFTVDTFRAELARASFVGWSKNDKARRARVRWSMLLGNMRDSDMLNEKMISDEKFAEIVKEQLKNSTISNKMIKHAIETENYNMMAYWVLGEASVGANMVDKLSKCIDKVSDYKDSYTLALNRATARAEEFAKKKEGAIKDSSEDEGKNKKPTSKKEGMKKAKVDMDEVDE